MTRGPSGTTCGPQEPPGRTSSLRMFRWLPITTRSPHLPDPRRAQCFARISPYLCQRRRMRRGRWPLTQQELDIFESRFSFCRCRLQPAYNHQGDGRGSLFWKRSAGLFSLSEPCTRRAGRTSGWVGGPGGGVSAFRPLPSVHIKAGY